MDLQNHLYDVVETRDIALADMEIHPFNYEYVGADAMVADEQLIASLATDGLIEPMKALEKTLDGKYPLMSGARRRDGLLRLGVLKARCEVVRLKEGVTIEQVMIAENGYRAKTERMKNIEAIRFIQIFSSSAKLRKLKALKGVGDGLESPSSPNGEDGGVDGIVARQTGESARTIVRRKLVHYGPDELEFLESIQPADCEYKTLQRLIDKCRAEWDEIRRQNNDGEISISRAAELVRELKARIQKEAGKSGKRGGAREGAGRKKREVEPAEVALVADADSHAPEHPAYKMYFTVNGVECGFAHNVAQPIVRIGEQVVLLSWEKIVRHADILS